MPCEGGGRTRLLLGHGTLTPEATQQTSTSISRAQQLRVARGQRGRGGQKLSCWQLPFAHTQHHGPHQKKRPVGQVRYEYSSPLVAPDAQVPRRPAE